MMMISKFSPQRDTFFAQLCSQFQFYYLIDSLFPPFSKFRRPRCDDAGIDI